MCAIAAAIEANPVQSVWLWKSLAADEHAAAMNPRLSVIRQVPIAAAAALLPVKKSRSSGSSRERSSRDRPPMTANSTRCRLVRSKTALRLKVGEREAHSFGR